MLLYLIFLVNLFQVAEVTFENEWGKMLLRSGVLINFTISIMLVWVMGISFVSICSLFSDVCPDQGAFGCFFFHFFFIATIFPFIFFVVKYIIY